MNIGKVYMMGMSGMGMAPLSIYLQQSGSTVCGYDNAWRSDVRDMLRMSGVEILESRDSLPEGVDVIVRSAAIREDHPLLLKARAEGIEVLLRGEMLARIAKEKKLIAVAGSHGKTSTSAMLITALNRAGFEFSYLLGGLFSSEGPLPARCSKSDWLIAELDESDGTIELFEPEISVILNIDWDHADRYESESAILEMFQRLMRKSKDAVFIPKEFSRKAKKVKRVFSFGESGDYRAKTKRVTNGRQLLELSGKFPSSLSEVNAMGRFNASNATVALALTHYLTGSLKPAYLAAYPGVKRRQGELLLTPGLVVYEDYAHHPSELESLINMARKRFDKHELVVVFQPHRYSRTAQFKKEFAKVLSVADRVCLLDVYAASESVQAGGETSDLFAEFEPGSAVVHCATQEELVHSLSPSEQAQAVFFIGAGDIDVWARYFVSTKMTDHSAWLDKVSRELSQQTILKENEPLAKKTTFGVGGPARYYAEPADINDLKTLLMEARLAGIEMFMLGRGSNLLVVDEGFDGLVIRLKGGVWESVKELGSDKLYAGSGTRLKQICGFAAKNEMAGFEFMEGIPGCIGGALRMNAGAMGNWVFDVVEEVHVVSKHGEVRVLPREAFHAEYRSCRELTTAYVLGAVIKSPSREASDSIRAKQNDFAGRRKLTQPREPSAGCIFKNPTGGHAGKIIDELGLKGKRIGGAEVSLKHGNFIVNQGDATCNDVIELVREIRHKVREERSIDLMPEVLLLGKKWEEVL